MAIATFYPSAGVLKVAANQTSQAVLLPSAGTPTTVVVSNYGGAAAFVLLGTSGVTVSESTGMVVNPGQSIALTLGTNTYLAAISSGISSILNVAVGS